MSHIKDKTHTTFFPRRAGKLSLHGEIPIANEHVRVAFNPVFMLTVQPRSCPYCSEALWCVCVMLVLHDEEKYNKHGHILPLILLRGLLLFQVMGSQGNLSAKIEEQTTEAIRNLTSSYHRNMETMMKKLMSTICDISPEIHPNFRPVV